jgi:hypothetical protein
VPLAFHYTDKGGYDVIRSAPTWHFLAGQPPGDHPFGAYFTNLGLATPSLAKRLRIPRNKLEWVFGFTDIGDLKRLDGGRGDYIFYAPRDYDVDKERQLEEFPKETGI